MSTQMHAPVDACQLLVSVGALERFEDDQAPDGPPKRRFAGKANSGGVLTGHWYWGNFAIDMRGLKVNRPDLPVLRDHDPGNVLGYTTKVTKGDEGIDVEGFLVGATEQAREVIAQLEAGIPLQMSVYVPPSQILKVAAGEEVEVNGRKLVGPGHVFKKSTLREATITALGADEATGANLLSARADGSPMVEVTELQQEQEIDTMTEPKKAPITAASLAEQHPDVLADIQSQAAEAAVKAERERIVFINSKATGIDQALVSQAVAEGWDRGTVAEKFLDHVTSKRADRLSEITAAAPNSTGGAGPKDDPTEFQEGGEPTPAEPAELSDEERWRKEFRASKELQDEFTEERRYIAFKRHE